MLPLLDEVVLAERSDRWQRSVQRSRTVASRSVPVSSTWLDVRDCQGGQNISLAIRALA